MKKLMYLFITISIVAITFMACEKHEPVVNNCPLLDLTTGQKVCACDADKVLFGDKCRKVLKGEYYGYNSDCSVFLDTLILDIYKVTDIKTAININDTKGLNGTSYPLYYIEQDTFYAKYGYTSIFQKKFCDVKLYGKFLDNPKRIRLRMNHIDQETRKDLGDCEMLLYPAK